MIDLAALAEALLATPAAQSVPISGGDICKAAKVETADGTTAFVKGLEQAPAGFFAAEAAGLRWLGAGGAPVPAVLAANDRGLALAWHLPGTPTAPAALQFGRDLAALHASGSTAFGALAPGASRSWVGTVPVPTDTYDTAAAHLAARLEDTADRATLSAADRSVIDALCAQLPALLGEPEPPARLHGDLWAGNIIWSADGPALFIDPAAHGGHRETDLAMLALFGAPYLDLIVESYQAVSPLGAGWQARVALHQVHPLLVHAALFGGEYGARAADVARSYL